MPRSPFKVLTEKEIETGRISIPAAVRDNLFPYLPENSKTDVTMVDEKEHSYDLVVKLRENRIKPEFLAKGGKNFVRKRKLQPSDVLVFSPGESPDHFRVCVDKSRRRGPLAPAPPPIEFVHGAPPPETIVPDPPRIGFIHASAIEDLALFGPLLGQSSPPIGHGAVAVDLGLPIPSMAVVMEEEEEAALNLDLTLGSYLAAEPKPSTEQEAALNLLTLRYSYWASLQDERAVKLSHSDTAKPKPSTELVLGAPPAPDF